MALTLHEPLEMCGPRPEMKHFELSDDGKLTCYRILKRLLADPCSLKESEWAEDSHPYSKIKCRLVYGKTTCDISVLDEKGNVQQSGQVATLDIYLRWRDGEKEDASLPNVQRVQNELSFLRGYSAKVEACFSLAKHELIREPSYSRRHNRKLQIVCEDVILVFCSGPGQIEVTVLYDDQKRKAVSHIALWEDDKCTREIQSA